MDNILIDIKELECKYELAYIREYYNFILEGTADIVDKKTSIIKNMGTKILDFINRAKETISNKVKSIAGTKLGRACSPLVKKAMHIFSVIGSGIRSIIGKKKIESNEASIVAEAGRDAKITMDELLQELNRNTSKVEDYANNMNKAGKELDDLLEKVQNKFNRMNK